MKLPLSTSKIPKRQMLKNRGFPRNKSNTHLTFTVRPRCVRNLCRQRAHLLHPDHHLRNSRHIRAETVGVPVRAPHRIGGSWCMSHCGELGGMINASGVALAPRAFRCCIQGAANIWVFADLDRALVVDRGFGRRVDSVCRCSRRCWTWGSACHLCRLAGGELPCVDRLRSSTAGQTTRRLNLHLSTVRPQFLQWCSPPSTVGHRYGLIAH